MPSAAAFVLGESVLKEGFDLEPNFGLLGPSLPLFARILGSVW